MLDQCIIYKKKDCFDCYTIFTPDGSVYGMSENPNSPMGFNNYIGDKDQYYHGKHLGKRIKPSELNEEVTKAIQNRLNDEHPIN